MLYNSASVLSSGAPVVTLRTAPQTPYDGAIAAARTCYSPRVIGADEVTESQRDSIGVLTFDAGHHTVYQHAHFEFGLENISRQFVWTFLHSYPFYNSEQSSQRYVKLKEPRAYVPPLVGRARDVFEAAVRPRVGSLRGAVGAAQGRCAGDSEGAAIRPSHDQSERLKQIEKDAEKRAIETARYVIPIAAFTSMVHTVSGIVLHRLHRMMNTGDAPHETRLVISEMVRLVKEWDPYFFDKVGLAPIPNEDVQEGTFPRPRSGGDCFAAEFDAPTERAMVTSARGVSRRRSGRGGIRAVGVWPHGERDGGRGGARPRAESGAKSLSARRAQRLLPLAAHARAAPCDLCVREAPQSHR